MELVAENTNDVVNKRENVFDHLDNLPDITLKELYLMLKASRKKISQRVRKQNSQAHSVERV